MTKQEYEFMVDLAKLMDKYQLSIEATTFNDAVYNTPSIQIKNPNGQIDIDLYGCLYAADIVNMTKIK